MFLSGRKIALKWRKNQKSILSMLFHITFINHFANKFAECQKSDHSTDAYYFQEY